MPSTIEAAFEDYLATLRATAAETRVASGHRTSIEAKLKAAFGMTHFFRTGSFGNGTNISGFSDVDYFAVIPRANLKEDSAVTLASLSEALRERFSTTPNIRVNGPAVRLPFGLDGAGATEIVPVDATGLTRLRFRQFDMPDGNGGWMFAAPESHNGYVTGIDDDYGGAVKPLIRFLKAWKFHRGVPIKSFYLEIRAAKYAMGESSIYYDMDISRLLSAMLADQLAAFPDPRFPNDGFWIESTNTVQQRVDAVVALGQAATWAADAVTFRQAGYIARAFDRWRLVFNGSFPAYTP